MKTDSKKWTVITSKYLMRKPWLTARQDHVRLPNGNENKEYYVLEYPDWVNVIAITTTGEFVFIRQYRHGLGETRFEIPAGVIDPTDPNPEAAARRELLEETGFTGGEWSLLTVLSGNASTTNNLCHCFIAEGVSQTDHQHLEATEDIEVVLLNREDVLKLLRKDEIKQSLMAAPLYKYFFLHHTESKS